MKKYSIEDLEVVIERSLVSNKNCLLMMSDREEIIKTIVAGVVSEIGFDLNSVDLGAAVWNVLNSISNKSIDKFWETL